MISPQSNRWMTFLDDQLLDEVGQSGNAFLWCGQQGECNNEPTDCSSFSCSVGNGYCKKAVENEEKGSSRKRCRDKTCSGPGNKACREKMRRDRLNDKFLELGSILEPGSLPKTDKATILVDAIRLLKQLRIEAQQVRESNRQLQENIKELKAEKNELRDEKLKWKAEKEKLEQQIKLTVIPGYVPHPASFHAVMAACVAQNQTAGSKATSLPGYPGFAMWRWMPPTVLDTSQDHVLRPPVA